MTIRLALIVAFLLTGLGTVSHAAQCFDPVYCKGGSLPSCVDHCLGLSEKIVTQNPDLEVSHPECVEGCDSACGRLCGSASVDETVTVDRDEVMEAGPMSLPPAGHLRVRTKPR
jgi:hypothetical protein